MNVNYKNRKYTVVPYDPKWRDDFIKEAGTLKSIFGKKALSIEHVGSTAIPELAGKPTIDILILVDDVSIASVLNQKMEEAGYKYLGEYVAKGVVLFIREEDNTRLVNVHIFQEDDPKVKEMLDLKNYILIHPEVAKKYSQLKLDLFGKYPDDYGSYRKYKDEWMEKLKEKIV